MWERKDLPNRPEREETKSLFIHTASCCARNLNGTSYRAPQGRAMAAHAEVSAYLGLWGPWCGHHVAIPP